VKHHYIVFIWYSLHAVNAEVELSLLFNKAQHYANISQSGGMATCILNLGSRCRWMVSFMSQPLYHQGKNPVPTLDRISGMKTFSSFAI
jgi:hypothetical protein